MKQCLSVWILGFCMLVMGAVQALSDKEAGKQLSTPCATCHGIDGNSVVTQWPKIAGQQAGYILSQLKEFKKAEKGLRNNPQMTPFLLQLSDQDMENLAAYFAHQKETTGEANGALVPLGKRIYEGGIPEQGVAACSSCHGPSGQGNGLANWPKLAGQHADYLKTQLMAYKTGTRRNGPGMMGPTAKRMTEEQMDAVSSYLQGMQQK